MMIPAMRPMPSTTTAPESPLRAGLLFQGDNRQLFGHGGVVLGKVLANVRDDSKNFTHSYVRRATPLQDRDTGVAVLV